MTPAKRPRLGGIAPQVNISRGGPLVTQKLLYAGQPGLLRVHQTNGEEMPNGMEPEGVMPAFSQSRCSISFIDGCRMECGHWYWG